MKLKFLMDIRLKNKNILSSFLLVENKEGRRVEKQGEFFIIYFLFFARAKFLRDNLQQAFSRL